MNSNDVEKILIVDDVPNNTIILAHCLQEYAILVAVNGETALRIAASEMPDLILLDINMPEMNGYEVCQRLKDDSATKDIPVIFVSARTDVKDITKGFSLGAVDYITKPIEKSIVLARVKNHLSLKWHRHALQKSNNELEMSIATLRKANENEEKLERQAQTIHAGRLTTLGEMATGIAHEMNQPLAGISYAASFLKKASELKKLSDEDLFDSIKDINDCVKRMSSIINHMRTFARQDSICTEACDIHETIKGALMLFGEQLRLHKIEVVLDYEQSLPTIECSPQQLEQVWINHITNSKDSLDEKAKKIDNAHKLLTIATKYNETNKTVDIIFSDNGMGMTEAVKTNMFNPFYTTKEVGKGTGLGLSVSHGIVINHQGKYTVDSKYGEGTVIRITLPIKRMEE